MSGSKNEHGIKYTPFVEYLRGRELEKSIEHPQIIRSLDAESFRVLIDRGRWPLSVLKESMTAVLKLTLQPKSCSLSRWHE